MKTKLTLLVLVAAITISQPNITQAQVGVQDSLALVDLYNSTDGPNWYHHDNWLTGPVGNWYGIVVSDNNVKQITLSSNNLKGSIPPELGKLKKLRYLGLGDNKLSGSIPSELGQCPFLRKLDLSNNQLTGSISPFWGYRLRYLLLNNNKLSGSIPRELGYYANLLKLHLENNQLSGRIPPTLGKLKYLIELNLKFNKLKDDIPSSLGSCTSLKYLILSHNKFRGNIPFTFSNLTELLNLNVGDNILGGEVPSFLGTMPNLEKLNIRHNHYTFDGLETLVQNNNIDSLKYERERLINLHRTNNTLSVYAGGTLPNNTYKWFKDGFLYATVTGDSTLQITESGAYNVEVTNAIATELTLFSDTISFNALTARQQNDIAANGINKNSFSVFPNPAKTIATIVFNETGNCIVKLTDVSGKVLQTKTVVANKGGNTLQLNVSNYAKGIYWITIVNEKNESRSIRLKKE